MRSLFELLYSKIPNVNKVKIFGCRAFAHRPNETRNGKLDSTAFPGIYLGKSIESDGVYILLDNSDKVMLAKHVKYREDEIPDRPSRPITDHNYTSRIGISTINSNDNIQRKKNFHLKQQEIRNKEAAIRLAAEEQEARRIIEDQNAHIEREAERFRK